MTIFLIQPHIESSIMTCFQALHKVNINVKYFDKPWVSTRWPTMGEMSTFNIGTKFTACNNSWEHKAVELVCHAAGRYVNKKHERKPQGEQPRKHTSGYSRYFLHVRKEKVTTCIECMPAERTTPHKQEKWRPFEHISSPTSVTPNHYSHAPTHLQDFHPNIGQGDRAHWLQISRQNSPLQAEIK